MNTQAKHTPGPWKLEAVNPRQRSSWQAEYMIHPQSGGAAIADVGPHDGSYWDAKLIAAAPDGLEVAQLALGWWHSTPEHFHAIEPKWVQAARDFIRRATEGA